MTDRPSRLVAVPAAVGLIAYASATQLWEAAVLLVLPALAAVIPKRFHPGRLREAILSAVVFAAGMFGIDPLVPDGLGQNKALGESGPRVAFGFLAVACLRLWLRRPWSGAPMTHGLAATAAALCGLWLSRNQYIAVAAAFLVGLALATGREAASRPAAAGKIPLRITAVVIALGATFLSAAAIPACHAAAYRGVTRAIRARRSGFQENIDLLRHVDIVESDRVMMRVTGPRVDYLRGVVFRRYSRGGWMPWTEPPRMVTTEAVGAREPGQVEIVPQRQSSIYFLPLESQRLSSEIGKAAVVEGGVVHVPPGFAYGPIRFRTGARDLPSSPVNEKEDLQIPQDLRPALEELARQWTEGANDEASRLAAIERRLQTSFAYSLRHDRSTRQDPVIDFLLVNRVGHCEYFATSMTLLARAIGIPARIVGGYRVSERNPMGDYWVVRARHAHSWVEAWVPGRGWTTFDPTPASATPELQPHTASLLGAIYDLFASGWMRERMGSGLGRRLLILLGSGVAVALMAAVIRARWRPRAPRRPEPLRYALPPKELELLLSTLGARGHRREGAETIEHFSGRLEAAGEGEAAAVLRRYAGWRYGGEGEGEQIAVELQAMATRLGWRQRRGEGNVAAMHQTGNRGEGG